MKRLNKDSGTMKNTVEAYLCASCSYCECNCSAQGANKSDIIGGPGSYASLNVRQF